MKASKSEIAEMEKLALERGGTSKPLPDSINLFECGCQGTDSRCPLHHRAGEIINTIEYPKKVQGRGHLVRHVQGQMNKTEAAYAEHLQHQKDAGVVAEYWFEGIKLRLAKLTTYSPDFLVLNNYGWLECHEVKGLWLPEGRVKIKIAAEMYFPFKFVAVTKKNGGGWEYEHF